jgi:hypothetical protein
MAAECNINLLCELSGLGKELRIAERFSTTAVPTRKFHQILVQNTADVAEALAVGDVGTIELIIMICVTNDVDVDTSFSTSFNAELTINEGELQIFKPTGTVYIKNDDATELSTVEYWVIGTA